MNKIKLLKDLQAHKGSETMSVTRTSKEENYRVGEGPIIEGGSGETCRVSAG